VVFVYFADCSGLLDLVFILDSSGSITRERFELVKKIVISTVNELDVRMDRTRVGLIYWSNNASVAIHMNDYGQVKQDVVEAIRRVPFLSNWTHSAHALRLSYQQSFQTDNGDRAGVPNVAVVITDGNSNVQAHRTAVEAAIGRRNGIRNVAVGLGDLVNVAELSLIASKPLNANMLIYPNVEEHVDELLDNLTAALLQTTCDG